MSKFMTRAQALKYGSLALLSAPLASHAVIDVASVVAGIAEAGVALLAVIGALLALSVLIFGIGKVYAFVKRKAGA
jgi:hypothetical protein